MTILSELPSLLSRTLLPRTKAANRKEHESQCYKPNPEQEEQPDKPQDMDMAVKAPAQVTVYARSPMEKKQNDILDYNMKKDREIGWRAI